MGVRASTLTGRAVVDDKLKHVTQWQGRRIDEMLVAHEHDLGGRFALGPRHAAVLLSTTEDASAEIFALMDTDHNDLVDAFEVMATFITLSGITIKQKIDVLHGLFDFSRTGALSVDAHHFHAVRRDGVREGRPERGRADRGGAREDRAVVLQEGRPVPRHGARQGGI